MYCAKKGCLFKKISTGDHCIAHSEKPLKIIFNPKFYYNRFIHKKEHLTPEERVKFLLKIPQPIQRSPEWYEMRHSMITASDIASIIGANKYSSRKETLLNKCGGETKKFEGNVATRHGQKYERIATLFYQQLTNSEVIEFGLVPHQHISWLGASPDGITTKGIMLEIKCPYYNRSIDSIPEYYLPQMQMQLECCDLEECDFLQCKFKDISIDEYKSSNEVVGTLICIEDYKTGFAEKSYVYPETIESATIEWANSQFEELNKSFHEENKRAVILYWRLEKYTLIKVQRDRKWFKKVLPELKQFWHDVEHYRKHPELIQLEVKKEISITLDCSTQKSEYLFVDSD